jgi:hypothetical protein
MIDDSMKTNEEIIAQVREIRKTADEQITAIKRKQRLLTLSLWSDVSEIANDEEENSDIEKVEEILTEIRETEKAAAGEIAEIATHAAEKIIALKPPLVLVPRTHMHGGFDPSEQFGEIKFYCGVCHKLQPCIGVIVPSDGTWNLRRLR